LVVSKGSTGPLVRLQDIPLFIRKGFIQKIPPVPDAFQQGRGMNQLVCAASKMRGRAAPRVILSASHEPCSDRV
jgi:hypothetical protein